MIRNKKMMSKENRVRKGMMKREAKTKRKEKRMKVKRRQIRFN